MTRLMMLKNGTALSAVLGSAVALSGCARTLESDCLTVMSEWPICYPDYIADGVREGTETERKILATGTWAMEHCKVKNPCR